LPAVLDRIPLAGGRALAVRTAGTPLDQFSLDARENEFLALLLFEPGECEGDDEYALRYARIDTQLFSSRPPTLPPEGYSSMPKPSGGGVENRFTDGYLVYGGSQGRWAAYWDNRYQYDPTELVVVPVDDPGAARTLSLLHSAERIEVFGQNVVVDGYRGNSGLSVSTIDLERAPAVADVEYLPSVIESEGRSHAFNSRLDADGGGVFGLPHVETRVWGGLLVTLVISFTGIIFSLPLGILLALGRRSQLPIVRTVSVIFIEFWRGVPLITVLFFATYMLPFFLPDDWRIDALARVLIGVVLFAGAYMAEVVRGGLQAIPRGQFEAADALGLSYPQQVGLIVLPQALKLVIPGIVGSLIALFKDTSLVLIIGIYDLLGMAQVASSAPAWLSPSTPMTAYVVAGAIFWLFCFGMSRYSQMLERRLAAGGQRAVTKAMD